MSCFFPNIFLFLFNILNCIRALFARMYLGKMIQSPGVCNQNHKEAALVIHYYCFLFFILLSFEFLLLYSFHVSLCTTLISVNRCHIYYFLLFQTLYLASLGFIYDISALRAIDPASEPKIQHQSQRARNRGNSYSLTAIYTASRSWSQRYSLRARDTASEPEIQPQSQIYSLRARDLASEP